MKWLFAALVFAIFCSAAAAQTAAPKAQGKNIFITSPQDFECQAQCQDQHEACMKAGNTASACGLQLQQCLNACGDKMKLPTAEAQLRMPCYDWQNNTNHSVVIVFHYLNTAFAPTGQTMAVGIQAGHHYPDQQLCYGNNSYATVELRGGGTPNWKPDLILGSVPGQHFVISP